MISLLFVFIATVAVNWLYALYIIHTANKHALKAALLAGLISSISSFVTVSYMLDKRAIIAMVIGSFVGTFVSIRYGKKIQQ